MSDLIIDILQVPQNYTANSQATREDIARVHNCTILYPEANQLFIDIDSEEQFQEYCQRYANLRQWFLQDSQELIIPSRSGLPHRHIIVTTKRAFSALERIALQAILNSDYKRDVISLIRVSQGNPNPIAFFELKEGSK